MPIDMPPPTEHHARIIAKRFLDAPVRDVQRFSMGGSNYVYGVTGADGRRLVVRIAVEPGKLAGFLHWHDHLSRVGVPLPALLAAETDAARFGFPYLILEWLPGTDLEHVYLGLSRDEKCSIAHALAAIQARVGTLPRGSGYGYARSHDDPTLRRQWEDVLLADLDRSRRRIREIGVLDARHVDRVGEKLPRYRDDLDRVAPVAFLDDTTTMNFLVEGAEIRGILDVDFVCFGDPLLTPALTCMALLSRGWETDYVGFWCERLPMDGEHERVLPAPDPHKPLTPFARRLGLSAFPDASRITGARFVRDRLPAPVLTRRASTWQSSEALFLRPPLLLSDLPSFTLYIVIRSSLASCICPNNLVPANNEMGTARAIDDGRRHREGIIRIHVYPPMGLAVRAQVEGNGRPASIGTGETQPSVVRATTD